MKKSGYIYIWACCLAAALIGARGASASEFQITADSFTVANQLNVSSATFYSARATPPPDPASATQLTTPGGQYFDGTYYNVWDRNALAWVRLATGTVSGSVAAGSVTPGTLGPTVIASSVAASAVGSLQLANSAVTDAKISGMSASKLTGAMPALDGSALTGVVSGQVPAAGVQAGSLGASVIASSVAASVVGSTQVADNSLRHVDMERGADTAVAGSAADVALGLNADLLDGLDSSGFAAASSGVCYTSWAGSTCAGGWTAVVVGKLAMSRTGNPTQGSIASGDPYCLRTDGDLLANSRTFGNYGGEAFGAIIFPNAGTGANATISYSGGGADTSIAGGISCAVCCK